MLFRSPPGDVGDVGGRTSRSGHDARGRRGSGHRDAVTGVRTALSLMLALAALVVSPAAFAVPVAQPGAATAVREHAGILVFSQYHRPSGLWYLTIRRPGEPPQRLPVAASRRPFDADIGPDSAGRPAVVYQRCAGPGVRDGCDLYVFSLSRPTGERAVRNANSVESDLHPTLWRGRIAWVRVYGTGARARPVIYTKRLTAPRSQPSERLPGVPRRRCAEDGDRCGATRARTVSALELYGRRLAAVVTYTCDACRGLATVEVRLDDVADGSARQVARLTSGLAGQTAVGPSFFAGRLAWYVSCQGDLSGCDGPRGGPFSYRIATGTIT